MKYLWLVGITLLIGCKSESDVITVDHLLGKWQLFHTTRNDKVSQFLDNTYFEFGPKDTLKSNLFKNEKLYYKKENDKIFQTGQTKMEYDIVKLNADTLLMKTNIGKNRYFIHLVKENNASN